MIDYIKEKVKNTMQYGPIHIDAEIKKLRFKIDTLDAFFLIGIIATFILIMLLSIPVLFGTTIIVPPNAVLLVPLMMTGIFVGSQMKDDYLQNHRKRLDHLTALKQRYRIEVSAIDSKPQASDLFATSNQDAPAHTPTGKLANQDPVATSDTLIFP